MSSTSAPAKKTTTAAKKTAAPAAAAAAPAPVAAPAPAPAPVAAPAAAPVPAVVPAATDATAVVEDGASLLAGYKALGEQIAAAVAALKHIQSEHKKQEREVVRAAKKLNKRRGRKATVGADGAAASNKPYVFTKLNNVTDALCVFLGKPKGTQFSRSEVTRAVIGYAREKGLMQGQNINTDSALRALLGVTEADKVTILNLQRSLKVHYLKTPTPAA
jgi:hypothetical protein